ncbi:MAG: hypothetical protein HUJ61_04970 [Bacilli bacterium]|nr:hypothetical protein [Bacilli bacterium]
MGKNDYCVSIIKRIEEWTTYAESRLVPFVFEIEDSFERTQKYFFKRMIIVHGGNKDVKAKLIITCQKKAFSRWKWEYFAKIYRQGQYDGEYHFKNESHDELFDFIRIKLTKDEEQLELDQVSKAMLYIVCSARDITMKKLIRRVERFYNHKVSYEELNYGLNILYQNGLIKLDNTLFHMVACTAKSRKEYKPFIFRKFFMLTYSKRNLPKIIEMFQYIKVLKSSYIINFPIFKEAYSHAIKLKTTR